LRISSSNKAGVASSSTASAKSEHRCNSYTSSYTFQISTQSAKYVRHCQKTLACSQRCSSVHCNAHNAQQTGPCCSVKQQLAYCSMHCGQLC
jgi:hypothetical protein